jgi:hypothetical protein
MSETQTPTPQHSEPTRTCIAGRIAETHTPPPQFERPTFAGQFNPVAVLLPVAVIALSVMTCFHF